MKLKTLLAFATLTSLLSCNNTKPETETEAPVPTPAPLSFYFKVEPDNTKKNFPAIQSFVFAEKNGYWLMFSGRTNGFHGFNSKSSNFPKVYANDSIFVYKPSVDSLYKMAIPNYGGDTANVFLCTNLAHTEYQGTLYACGGYGIRDKDNKDAKKTYDYFMSMDLEKAISAVIHNDPNSFKQNITWGQSKMVCATGGELYRLPDGNFYMNLGHKFTGVYGGGSPSPNQQQYKDTVWIFALKSITTKQGKGWQLENIGNINDGLPDSTTQFHRRDLVVAPSVLADGSSIGLAIYGGVFTQGNNFPFSNPIYINPATSPKYKLDPYNQYLNIYSTSFMSHYDTETKTMMTTLFGGIGNAAASGFSGLDSNANWSNVIATNKRMYANGGDVTTQIQDTGLLPAYLGSESVFVPDANVPFYNKEYNIIDYAKLGKSQSVGYIFGGIISNQCCSDSTGSTWPSTTLYKVSIYK